MGRMARAFMDAKGFEPAWVSEFHKLNPDVKIETWPRVKLTVAEPPKCFPVACRFCRTHFRGRGALRFHWCWWDTSKRFGRVDPSASADSYRGIFPIVRMHLSADDCATPSTWWYQARAIADQLEARDG